MDTSCTTIEREERQMDYCRRCYHYATAACLGSPLVSHHPCPEILTPSVYSYSIKTAVIFWNIVAHNIHPGRIYRDRLVFTLLHKTFRMRVGNTAVVNAQGFVSNSKRYASCVVFSGTK